MMLGVGAGTATAQDVGALLQLAPPLAGLGRVVPLGAPVEVTRAGWGPFRRACTEYNGQGTGAGQAGVLRCLRIRGAQAAAASGWRVHVEPDEAIGLRGPQAVTMLRRDDGAVTEVTVPPQDGNAPPLAPAQQVNRQSVAHASLASLGIVRQRLSPGTPFTLPRPWGWMERAVTETLDCLPEGRAVLAGRDVVVARCGGRFETPLGSGSTTLLATIAGRSALDVETGVLVARSHVERIETLDAPPGQEPRPYNVHTRTERTWLE